MGKIATGNGILVVNTAAQVSDSEEHVSLTASETLINQVTNFELSVDLPLPLNRGCQIDLYIPDPLFIGAEFVDITIGGMFGQVRPAVFTIDATSNLIKI